MSEVRKLAESSGDDWESRLVSCLPQAVALLYADSRRRERQRHVRLGRRRALARRLGDGPRDGRRCGRHRSGSRSQGYPEGGCHRGRLRARRPERVSHLILYGAFALGGSKRSPAEKEKTRCDGDFDAHRMDADNPAFRQMFTGFYPAVTHEQVDISIELQRKSYLSRVRRSHSTPSAIFDIRDLLSKVTAPTLVMHTRDDQIVPFEAGRQLAAGIPGVTSSPCPA